MISKPFEREREKREKREKRERAVVIRFSRVRKG